MGDLPAPPAALAWVLYALAIFGGAIAIVTLLTGRRPKLGLLRRISSPAAARTIALAELLLSAEALVLALAADRMSRHIEPPHWLELVALVIFPVAAFLEWQAWRIDQRSRPSPSI